jgi:hypothetical protein
MQGWSRPITGGWQKSHLGNSMWGVDGVSQEIHPFSISFLQLHINMCCVLKKTNVRRSSVFNTFWWQFPHHLLLFFQDCWRRSLQHFRLLDPLLYVLLRSKSAYMKMIGWLTVCLSNCMLPAEADSAGNDDIASFKLGSWNSMLNNVGFLSSEVGLFFSKLLFLSFIQALSTTSAV